MLSKLTNIFTTATSAGVTTRYLIVVASSMLTLIGALNLLSPEQVEALQAQIPIIASAIGTLIGAIVIVYANITKSHTDKAAEAAKQIDLKIPIADPVVIQTPGKQSDIKIDVTADGSLKK